MPIDVQCQCGKKYSLKDEFQGRQLKCPSCSSLINVPTMNNGGTKYQGGTIGPRGQETESDQIFGRDKFLLRQKFLAIKEKYAVADESGASLLYVERPRNVFLGIVAILVAIVSAIAVGAIVAGILSPIFKGDFLNNPFQVLAFILIFVLAIAAAILAAMVIQPKRHIGFYSDQSKTKNLLTIMQDSKFQIIIQTFTVILPGGAPVARFKKNYLYNIFRKRWIWEEPSGRLVSLIKEDSVLLSLLRRFLGPLFGVLRANFIFLDPQNEKVLGEFNRKFTILDRYMLDLSHDRERKLDRRVALAMGVMLDTGERR